MNELLAQVPNKLVEYASKIERTTVLKDRHGDKRVDVLKLTMPEGYVWTLDIVNGKIDNRYFNKQLV